MNARLHGLYVITDAQHCAERGLPESVAATLRGGARLVQYRDKSNDHGRRLDEVRQLFALCEQHDAQLIVNDDVELARHAHGVHLGRDDMNPERARRVLGRNAIVGISCYDDFALAEAAMRTGANYAAFGSVFPSPTKPDAVRAPLELFQRAREELAIPVCAIGGINRNNIHDIVHAGADMIAVVSAVFAADDIEMATRELVDAARKAR
ncbi:MAG TPA: thiamine phosphate synthase [Gammaproteobacteria bacterium]